MSKSNRRRRRPRDRRHHRTQWSTAGIPGHQIVKQWTSVRSFVIKDGHLFLALMADGVICEPLPSKKH
jgi:hypothetical protein